MIVQPAHLLTAAATVHSNRADLKAELDATHGTIESARAGWVGASAAALTGRLGSWRDRAEKLDEALARHGDRLSASALEFREVDATNVRILNL